MDASVVRLRAGIQTVDQYVPGRRAGAGDGTPLVGLASNECPYPPFPSVLEALGQASAGSNRYAAAFAEPLREVIAERWRMPVDRVVAGSGLMTICTHVLLATCDPGSEVVYAWPSFVGYPLMTSTAGARGVPVPVTPEGRHDLAAMLDAITPRTRVVFVCNPNNPTGTVLATTEIEDFLSEVRDDVLVVLDEAYAEFSEECSDEESRRLLASHPQLLLGRTFSKAYGLAGLRAGYALASSEVASIVQSMLPFNVGAPAMAGAVAALAEQELLTERIAEVCAERSRVIEAARMAGLDLPESHGNFIWLPTAAHAARLDTLFESHRILSRLLPPFGVRVTLGTQQQNSRLIEALRAAAEIPLDVTSQASAHG